MVARGHAWLLGGVRSIRQDTVNERAVRILLECILVYYNIWLQLSGAQFPLCTFEVRLLL